MICSIVHEGKGEKEKKKKRRRQGMDFPYLPISASLTGHVSNPRNQTETLFFGAFAEWQTFSSSPEFEALTSIQKSSVLRPSPPEMWPRNRFQRFSWHLLIFKQNRLLQKKKKRKKIRLLTSPKPSESFIFLLPLCVYLANLFELWFVSDFRYRYYRYFSIPFCS